MEECLFRLLFLLLLFSPALFVYIDLCGQESVEFLHLCEKSDDILRAASSHGEFPLAVSLSAGDLKGVSGSILLAETWLRSNVLAHYPAAKITNIVVGSSAFCQQHQQQKNLAVVHSALKNVYHSLKRWGLEHDIKVSVAFRLDCLTQNSASYKDDLKMVEPLMWFLQSVNSTFSVIPHEGFSHFANKNLSLVSPHLESMKKLGFFYLNNRINVVTNTTIVPKEGKAIARKLLVSTFPIRPTPMPEIAEPPLDFPVGYPTPANVATEPLPPLAQVVSSPPPMSSSTFAPQEQPPPTFVVPASSPHGFTLPPCNPIDNGSPYPQIIPVQKLWCVAKPSVPEETLQQALDYACGEGGADCMEITPQGNCYYPDTVVAHASYAFNSYWQKHKRNGGTCSFGGTAMLINSDPSFLHCRFVLS